MVPANNFLTFNRIPKDERKPEEIFLQISQANNPQAQEKEKNIISLLEAKNSILEFLNTLVEGQFPRRVTETSPLIPKLM